MTDNEKERAISKSVLKLTKCPNAFQCLSDISYPRCRIHYVVGTDPALFVDRANNGSCPYCIPFGDSYLCSCPVRKELYAKYHV